MRQIPFPPLGSLGMYSRHPSIHTLAYPSQSKTMYGGGYIDTLMPCLFIHSCFCFGSSAQLDRFFFPLCLAPDNQIWLARLSDSAAGKCEVNRFPNIIAGKFLRFPPYFLGRSPYFWAYLLFRHLFGSVGKSGACWAEQSFFPLFPAAYKLSVR